MALASSLVLWRDFLRNNLRIMLEMFGYFDFKMKSELKKKEKDRLMTRLPREGKCLITALINVCFVLCCPETINHLMNFINIPGRYVTFFCAITEYRIAYRSYTNTTCKYTPNSEQ